ncbi:MAG TPA: disulfide bond formation protein B [Alphaproteobacteria bacterium]
MTTLAARNPILWRYAPALLLFGSGGLLLAALFFQYVMKLPPCPLCHWQRWPHIAVVVLAAAALASGPGSLRPWLLALIGVALLATAAVGVFHAGVEQKWWAGLSICEGGADDTPIGTGDLTKALNQRPAPRCDQIAWSLFGLSMAAWNAIISFALAAYAFRAALAGGRGQ